ncbi:MAG: MlaD family protein, partial [Pseudomonadota bacterium]
MSDDIPDIPHSKPERRRFSGISLVWLVPIAALLVALSVTYTTYSDRGPLIRISFDDAAGILAGETELRFRNVTVGLVEDVTFNDDLTRVLVDVRVENDVAPFLDANAEFWIVRPQVTASGVTGLQTVLSGVYLEGSWDNNAEGIATSFIGLEEAPLATANVRGTRFELRSTRPSGLSENTPILFKGIEVGRLGPARISRDGSAVFAEAIIFEPHDRLVSTATRFWDASGFSVTIGPQGAALDFSSLASLVSGGITFDTLVSGGEPLTDGLVFQVFPDEASARNSIFEESDGETVTFTMIFNENVSGLAAESPVEWRGVRIGRIVNVTGIVDRERFGDARVRLLATAEIRPARIGLVGEVSQEEALDYLEERVGAGLRARLASGSILTGGLKIELVLEEDAVPAEFERDAVPFPILPVTDSEISDVTATAEGVLSRVNALPVEELLSSAIAFLDNATALVASEGLREAPNEILGLLGDARGVIGSDEVQALPGDVSALLEELRGASTDLRNVLAEFQEAGAVERVLAAIDGLGAAAEAANAALAGAPELITQRCDLG